MHFDMFAGVRNMQREYCRVLIILVCVTVSIHIYIYKVNHHCNKARSACTGDLEKQLLNWRVTHFLLQFYP